MARQPKSTLTGEVRTKVPDLQFSRVRDRRRPTSDDKAVQQAYWDPTKPHARQRLDSGAKSGLAVTGDPNRRHRNPAGLAGPVDEHIPHGRNGCIDLG